MAGIECTTTTGYTITLDHCIGDTTTTTGWTTVKLCTTRTIPPPARRILVKTPKKWSKKTAKAYVKLINKKTRTGWVVSMLIDGKVTICDPTIEKRKMKQFKPLLLWNASVADTELIKAFFKKHGC